MNGILEQTWRAKVSQSWFNLVHRHNLVYNTCWEDPELDREAMQLGPDDRVLVITSAGCNSLDYALDGPAAVLAVDVNPIQNALLELKQVAIRELDYATFFELFGKGRFKAWDDVYQDLLRPALRPASRAWWDRRGDFFSAVESTRPSFYFRGSAGWFARWVNWYIDRVVQLRPAVEQLLEADSVEEQREVYERHRFIDRLWTPLIRRLLQWDTTMSLLGVPRAQRRQLDLEYPGGIVQFIVDRVTTVFTRMPLRNNYFWRLYLTGRYSADCSPRYLTRDGFARLKQGLVNRVDYRTSTILDCLTEFPGTFSRFVLLDHMDWLGHWSEETLARQWEQLLDRAAPNARILWRSAGFSANRIHDLVLPDGNGCVGDRLRFQLELAETLHRRDRVNTYGSFWIADVVAP